MAADSARDHRCGEAQLSGYDDRKQRSSEHPRDGSASGASERAADTAAPTSPTEAAGLRAAVGRATASPHEGGTSASGGLRTMGIPIGKMGARLHQAHR